METCLNHPEVRTDRRCALCAQAFCDGCLEPLEPVGPVCAECERVLEAQAPEQLEARLPQLRLEVQREVPPYRRWWGWELAFGLVLLAPALVVAFYLHQLFQYHQAMALLSREPLLPGQVTTRLTDVGAALERYYAAHGAYPEALDALKAPDLSDPALLTDLYSFKEERLIYRLEEGTYILCSRGPDRTDSNGIPLDRFSGLGDLCLGGSS